MKIYKITEASEYLGVSINTLKTLASRSTTLGGTSIVANGHTYMRILTLDRLTSRLVEYEI